LGDEVYEEELRTYFSKFGEIADLKLIFDHIKKKPKGYAFLNFARPQDAEIAQKDSNQKSLFGGMQ
jgi:RNA recognition motif-containing protein